MLALAYSMPRMDPNNPVMQLCAAGMTAEAEGRGADAKALFEQAWEESRDDFDACVAAHYVARHQATLDDELDWNRKALERANLVADDRVRGFYPSLYLNLAHSLEKLGRTAEAREFYATAADWLESQPDSPYLRLVRSGIAAGQQRTGPTNGESHDARTL
jgi:tetratricopeptide (TPR) repeat protein